MPRFGWWFLADDLGWSSRGSSILTPMRIPYFFQHSHSTRICIGETIGGQWVIMKRGEVVRRDPALEDIYYQAVTYLKLVGNGRGFPPQDLL